MTSSPNWESWKSYNVLPEPILKQHYGSFFPQKKTFTSG